MNKRKFKLKINILPKLLLSVILLSLLSTFITIEPVRVLELSIKTYKSKYVSNYGEVKETRKYQSSRYEFAFEYLDILDLTKENSNGTINVNRIHYEKSSSLYHFFSRFQLYHKVYLSFIIFLFISVLISFFFPYSNNIFKDSQSRKFKKTLLFTSFFLFYIPIFIVMVLLLSLDFKGAVKNDSKDIQELNKICYNKDGELFGFCNSYGLSDYRNSLSMDQLIKETVIKNNTLYGWDKYEWDISILNIKMILSYFFVFITFGFLIYIVFYNTIKGHKFNKEKKSVQQQPDLNEMIDLQISKNNLSEPSTSNKSFKNQSSDSINSNNNNNNNNNNISNSSNSNSNNLNNTDSPTSSTNSISSSSLLNSTQSNLINKT